MTPSKVNVLDTAASEEVLRRARRIAVLGIKPESLRDRAAFYIPAYLADVGYEIVPVPTAYPGVTSILGRPVQRTLRDVGPVQILSVFMRPEEVPAYVTAMLELRPEVWFQSGLMHEASAGALIAAGIAVAHECIGCRRAAISPGALPLEGQRP